VCGGWTWHQEATAPRRRYLEQELLEVSAVAIPAIPDAPALGLKSGAGTLALASSGRVSAIFCRILGDIMSVASLLTVSLTVANLTRRTPLLSTVLKWSQRSESN
jgi:hypothetical protein